MAVSRAVRGRDATILVDGIDASEFLNEYEFESERDDIDVTPFGSDSKIFLSGSAENTCTLTGFWNGEDDSLDELLDSTFGDEGENTITICPRGDDVGSTAYLCSGTQVSYNVSAQSDDLTEAEAEFRTGRVRGKVLKPFGVVTTTGDGTGVEWAAASSKGATANLHVKSLAGTSPTLTVEVEHSVDDTTYVSLISFTVTEKGGQQKSTAKNVTVNKFLRETRTIGGTTPTADYALIAGQNQ